MKNLVVSIRMVLVLTAFLGIGYPFAVTGIASLFFPQKAGGGIVMIKNQAIGANLIAQKFEQPKYFWSRPSAVDYNPLPSGGSNQGQASSALKSQVVERSQKLAGTNSQSIPQDLLFASGSGLDPHLSPEGIIFQIPRVAAARAISPDDLKKLVDQFTEGRQFGIFGEPRVNVLALNIALDQFAGPGAQ